MDFGQLLVGRILPYAALLFFLVSIIYRITKWMSAPQALKWSLYDVPDAGRKWTLGIFSFFGLRSLFRYNRGLWLGAWVFHMSLWAILLWHVIRFAGWGSDFWFTIDEWIDMICKWTLLGSLIYIVIFRVAVRQMREITGTVEYFNLALMLAIVISGIQLKGNVDPYSTGMYLVSLITFGSEPFPEGGTILIVHWLLSLLLLIMLPYGKMSHFLSQYVSKSRIDWVNWNKKKYMKAR